MPIKEGWINAANFRIWIKPFQLFPSNGFNPIDHSKCTLHTNRKGENDIIKYHIWNLCPFTIYDDDGRISDGLIVMHVNGEWKWCWI